MVKANLRRRLVDADLVKGQRLVRFSFRVVTAVNRPKFAIFFQATRSPRGHLHDGQKFRRNFFLILHHFRFEIRQSDRDPLGLFGQFQNLRLGQRGIRHGHSAPDPRDGAWGILEGYQMLRLAAARSGACGIPEGYQMLWLAAARGRAPRRTRGRIAGRRFRFYNGVLKRGARGAPAARRTRDSNRRRRLASDRIRGPSGGRGHNSGS